jgi:hypothetical protein
MSITKALMAYFTAPSSQRQVEPPDLRRWKVFDLCDRFPIFDPLATFARQIDPDPSLLTFAAEVHSAQRNVPNFDLCATTEAENSMVQMRKGKLFSTLPEHWRHCLENVSWFCLSAKTEPIDGCFLRGHRMPPSTFLRVIAASGFHQMNPDAMRTGLTHAPTGFLNMPFTETLGWTCVF